MIDTTRGPVRTTNGTTLYAEPSPTARITGAVRVSAQDANRPGETTTLYYLSPADARRHAADIIAAAAAAEAVQR